MSALPRAHELGLIGCHVCGLVCRDTPMDDAACPRCGSALHRRKTASYARTWALLIAGFLLYIPANVLPIMRTASLGDVDDNTIISGVMELWNKGSPDLAVIVFTASILVPMTKFFVLTTLLVSARRGSNWARPQRAKLYRLVEFIGYWSMLDVFVVALLTALVQFGIFSLVAPLPGVIFFGLTVVLTMLASMSFDPRLIWDGRTDDD
ncbi:MULTISPECIES: paraquat-inducible protein A [Rhodanobacter]|jgi:paraquat-inducible protein A|uniref:Paraquat-inducible protein A n=1 Tax=Rhodanobacter glycinis TaxID=582702 RepID=A0A1I4EI41_9GAMM|nr:MULTISPECIES: paraquat-inducible protein A [Rhodanobacter]EIL96432.1 putative paraquat-inducible protein A [Rhodanobacter sp. 115]QEE24059.1 paraquat-inducible protein A [Rhodanobacter glycinis]TAM30458.1 MAG: paraquat-inducible protein A [Rhodanobacter sp.]SFL04237.1 paraquat-inducible protein A [Rhodanobacter glycinis]